MALIDYLKPSYPTKVTDETGIHRTYVMRGKVSVLTPLMLGIGQYLDGGKVYSTSIDVIETSDYIDYTVQTCVPFAQTTIEIDDDQYPAWEIDQVQIEKDLKQHPSFISFSASDWAAIYGWEEEVDQYLKTNNQYYMRDYEGKRTGSVLTLSMTQAKYAYLVLRGAKSFLDFAPVVRKTSQYLGSVAPSCADAGQKTTAPSYAPSGYEWLKTADRVQRQGSKSMVWMRQEEWTGARKVLLDKDSLFTP